MTTPTEDSRPGLSPTVPMPRIRAVVEFSEVVEVTVRPGVNTVRFLISVTPESLSSWADRAITEIGTSWMFSARFCAVTMTSGRLGTGASSAAQLTLPATAPVDAKTKVANRRISRIRLVIDLPSVRQSVEQRSLKCCCGESATDAPLGYSSVRAYGKAAGSTSLPATID